MQTHNKFSTKSEVFESLELLNMYYAIGASVSSLQGESINCLMCDHVKLGESEWGRVG